MDEIANAESTDQNFYWYLVNKSRKKQGRAKHPIKVNGTSRAVTLEEICKIWKKLKCRKVKIY